MGKRKKPWENEPQALLHETPGNTHAAFMAYARFLSGVFIPVSPNDHRNLRVFPGITHTPYFKGEPCWPWIGFVNRFCGYGQFSFTCPGRKSQTSGNIGAHRFSFFANNGDLKDGLVVRHRCNNRTCVNPAHLELGTYQMNWQDLYNKREEEKRAAGQQSLLTLVEEKESLDDEQAWDDFFNLIDDFIDRRRKRLKGRQ